MLHALIMAGGSGTRFWPASRAQTPKQLLDLTGDQTMIQATVDRLADLVPPERVLIVTNQRLVSALQDQLPQLPAASIVGEPCRRDTAPCVGLAAAWVLRDDPEATMVVMPADHVIQRTADFQDAMQYASELVAEQPSRLVTLGIAPSYAAESFGYIERDEPISAPAPSSPPTYRVKQFCEKPQAAVARKYVESGRFYWNSGIFVWSAATILDALQEFELEMYDHLMTIADSFRTARFEEVFRTEFEAIEGRSIDYAVMEKARDVVVIEAPFDWDDVGSWQALARLRGTDENGNTLIGKTLCLDTTGTIVRCDEGHLIATLGLQDCIVVRTKDATLVANKHHEEAVREIVRQLGEKGWTQFL